VRGIESVTMLMADFGYTLHSQTYIATEETLANRRAELVALMAGEAQGWNDYRADLDAATDLTLARFPDAGLDRATQLEQARRQVPLMFSALTDAQGFGWFTDETVAQNIETLALLGMPVSADLWDRSILDEVHG
jgi:NitT/TauT family transport system substrate-binding protein